MSNHIRKIDEKQKRSKDIGDRLRVLRKSKFLTRQNVADFLEVDISTYARYELGNSQINYDTIVKLSVLFNVDYNTLLCYEKSASKYTKGAWQE